MIFRYSPIISKLLLQAGIIVLMSGASACQQSTSTINIPPPSSPSATKAPHLKATTPISTAKPQILLPTKLHQINHGEILFNIVTFDTRKQNLIIADQPKGPGSVWPDAASAGKANNGIASINAGFFTPEGEPLGVVIANGKKSGSYNKSSLGTGMFYHTPTGANISRRSIWNKLTQSPPSQLLQSGPMLLERSKNIAGLSTSSSRVRSFIATDGKNHWCIGHASSCTLAQLSKALSTLQIKSFKPTTALNLDGGRSSDLWVSSSITTEPKTIRPFWNKPVRNFLILK
jgi:uncharacterized protein YigE (DUF2233 family)